MAIRKHDLDVPRDATGHRVKDNNLVVSSGVNKEVTGRAYDKTNKVFLLEVEGETGDTFTLTLDGIETDDIDFDAEPDDVQAALVAAYGNPDTQCSGEAGAIEIECIGDRAGSNATTLTVDDTGMVGMDSTAVISVDTAGDTDEVLTIKGGSSVAASSVTRV